jgi:RNA polymerase-binding transcription factor DksA
MTAVPAVPIVGDEVGAVESRDDIAARLHAMLISRRAEEAEQLGLLGTARDSTDFDEHAEIAATVATETLREIERALARFEDGTYGTCELCGEVIPLERLEVIPESTTCVNCARTR